MDDRNRQIGEAIEQMTATLEQAGIWIGAVRDGGVVTLTGAVDSPANRDAALDVARMTVGRIGVTIVDALEVLGFEPDSFFEDEDAKTRPDWDTEIAGAPRDPDRSEMEMDPDFTDDAGTTDPMVAAAEGMPWFPPTDPVVRPRDSDEEISILNGFAATAPDDDGPDGRTGIPDDSLSNRIVRALAQDALTSDLLVRVAVRNGIVYLHGEVPTMDDAENAEAVASRIDGVIEVRESLRVASLRERPD
jgi:hypothetical protein